MTLLIAVFRRLAKLFVDDNRFALAIVAWLAAVVWLLPLWQRGAARGPILLFGGLAGILLAGSRQVARQKRAVRPN